jgi:division protein CdvB (Snf7/Vps24/ESCRT-III family)
MNTRQELLAVIEQLPDQQLRSLLELARSLTQEEKSIDLQAHGIDEQQAAELRSRLDSFAEEWNSPEMDIYDDYDNHRK